MSLFKYDVFSVKSVCTADAITTSGNFVVIGTEKEIEHDSLCGGYYDEDEDTTEMTDEELELWSSVAELLDDTGHSCEDYVVHTFKEESELVTIMESFGYVRDVRLRDCGWC